METKLFKTNGYGRYYAFVGCQEITKGISRGGMFQPDIIENWIHPNLKPGTCFLDLGANIGVYSIWTATKYTDVDVIAIEAHPEVFELLEKNKKLNKVKNLSIYNLAVFNKSGEELDMLPLRIPKGGKINFGDQRIFDEVNRIGKNRDTNWKGFVGAQFIDGLLSVKSIRVDSMKINKPVSAIKIDVQGYDWYAINGCEGILKKDKPVVVIEWTNDMVGVKDISSLEIYMGGLGYKRTGKYMSDYLFEYENTA